ncbi:MAG TPA: hypothetical protein VGU63_07570 [Candidatus Acidoferrales bacterium]|nr:hypothetical protein [Candidatus Acidoferrales bacterium]
MAHLEFNELKLRTLAIFAAKGSLTPPEWAVSARFYPVRASYTYLLRLHRWGLLLRYSARGRVVYSLSARGRRRLTWLRVREARLRTQRALSVLSPGEL